MVLRKGYKDRSGSSSNSQNNSLTCHTDTGRNRINIVILIAVTVTVPVTNKSIKINTTWIPCFVKADFHILLSLHAKLLGKHI